MPAQISGERGGGDTGDHHIDRVASRALRLASETRETEPRAEVMLGRRNNRLSKNVTLTAKAMRLSTCTLFLIFTLACGGLPSGESRPKRSSDGPAEATPPPPSTSRNISSHLSTEATRSGGRHNRVLSLQHYPRPKELAVPRKDLTNEAFDRVFLKRQQIRLQKPVTGILAFVGDYRQNIWLFDYPSLTLRKYSPRGRCILELTGPGVTKNKQDAFGVVFGLAVDSQGRVYVANTDGRIVVLTPEGHYLRSVVTKEMGVVTALAVDEKRNTLYMSGTPAGRIDIGQIAHRFELADWKHIDSFLDVPSKVRARHLTSYNFGFLDVDADGEVFIVHQVVHGLFKYDPVSRKLVKFPCRSQYYRSPPDFSTTRDIHEILNREGEWSRVAKVWVTGPRVIVAIMQYTPFKYLLEIYDLNGHLVATDLMTQLTPVGRDQQGRLYFYDEEHPSTLVQYGLRETGHEGE